MEYTVSVESTGLGVLGVGSMWDTIWRGEDKQRAFIKLEAAMIDYPSNKVQLTADPNDGRLDF